MSFNQKIYDIFQLTHPTRSATKATMTTAYIMNISTHAPHAECDNVPSSGSALNSTFQLTHPTRSATSPLVLPYRGYRHFNSRTPRGVRHPNIEPYEPTLEDFNSRTPRGVRPLHRRQNGVPPRFQLTHPTRSATHSCRHSQISFVISTHAPHAECDY